MSTNLNGAIAQLQDEGDLGTASSLTNRLAAMHDILSCLNRERNRLAQMNHAHADRTNDIAQLTSQLARAIEIDTLECVRDLAGGMYPKGDPRFQV